MSLFLLLLIPHPSKDEIEIDHPVGGFALFLYQLLNIDTNAIKMFIITIELNLTIATFQGYVPVCLEKVQQTDEAT